jgi:hypothetical protein
MNQPMVMVEGKIYMPKSKVVAYFLWAAGFIGVFGLHRFYTRNYVIAVLQLLTFGLLLVGWIVDLFLLAGKIERHNRFVYEAWQREQERNREAFRFSDPPPIRGTFRP